MNWNIDILKAEADILKKIHAFKLFKEMGMYIIEQDFPRLKQFILNNYNKSIEQFESEQMSLLEKMCETV